MFLPNRRKARLELDQAAKAYYDALTKAKLSQQIFIDSNLNPDFLPQAQLDNQAVTDAAIAMTQKTQQNKEAQSQWETASTLRRTLSYLKPW